MAIAMGPTSSATSSTARCPFSFVHGSRVRGPGPRGHWLTGSLAEFRGDLLGFLTRIQREHGDLVPFRVGHRRFLSVTAVEHVPAILGDSQRFGLPFREITRRVLGNGLITSEDADWLARRRHVQPAFSTDGIVSQAPVMVEAAARRVAAWRDGQVIDAHDAMVDLTTDVVGRALFGVALPDAVRADIRAALVVITGHMLGRVTRLISWPGWVPVPANVRYRQAARSLDRAAGEILALARASGGSPLMERIAPGGAATLTTELRDQIVSFLLAGLEGTALTLSWTWYLLAAHPAVDDQLIAHLDEVIGDRAPTAEDLPRLTYAEQVVREAMRLYPPVWGILRRARVDCEVGGLPVSRGTIVIIPQWVIHHDARWFPEPDVFRPQRWAPMQARLPKGSYFPFGSGQRQCVGGGLALTAAVMILATMARHIRFERVPGAAVELEPFMSLRPRNGLPLVVRRRRAL